MVTHQLQVQCRPVKVRRSETDVLPLSHPTNDFAIKWKAYTATPSSTHITVVQVCIWASASASASAWALLQPGTHCQRTVDLLRRSDCTSLASINNTGLFRLFKANVNTLPSLQFACMRYMALHKFVFAWLKPGLHYPSLRPELTARIDGWPVSITRQHGPCWRAPGFH